VNTQPESAGLDLGELRTAAEVVREFRNLVYKYAESGPPYSVLTSQALDNYERALRDLQGMFGYREVLALLTRIETLQGERDDARAEAEKWKCEAATAWQGQEAASEWNWELKAQNDRLDIHVESLWAERKRMREALEWYADEANYDEDGVLGQELMVSNVIGMFEADMGQRARAALAPHPEADDV